MAHARPVTVVARNMIASVLVAGFVLAACSGGDKEPSRQEGGNNVPAGPLSQAETTTTSTLDTSGSPDPETADTQPPDGPVDAPDGSWETRPKPGSGDLTGLDLGDLSDPYASEFDPDVEDRLTVWLDGAPDPVDGVYDSSAVAAYFESSRGSNHLVDMWLLLWSISAPGTPARSLLTSYMAGATDLDSAVATIAVDRAVGFVAAQEAGQGRELFPEFFGAEPGTYAEGAAIAVLGAGATSHPDTPAQVMGVVTYQILDGRNRPIGSPRLMMVSLNPDGWQVVMNDVRL